MSLPRWLLLCSLAAACAESPVPPPDDDDASPEGDWPALALNEVSCAGDDWIELAGPPGADASAWVVSDGDALAAFTLGAALDAAGLLLVRRDELAFGLGCGSDTVHLVRPDGTGADSVAVPELEPGTTWGRLPDASGAWTATAPTPGATNRAAVEPPPEGWPALALNEVDCASEWIELAGPAAGARAEGWRLEDAGGGVFVLPAGTVVPGFLRVDPSFGVGCGDDVLTLVRPDGVAIDSVAVPETAATWGRLPDVTGEWAETLATPGAANAQLPAPIEPPPGGWPAIALNEIDCHGDEWIELAGPPGADASGWALTDDPERAHVLPAGTALDAAGLLVVVEITAFAIAGGTDSVTLLRPDASVADTVAVPDTAGTWGRLPDLTGEWAETQATPGAPNAQPPAPIEPPPGGWPALVLNEVDCGDEWIELAGPPGTDASGWVLTDAPAEPERGLVLPAGTTVAGWLVVPAFGFAIACGTDSVTLLRPDASVADSVAVPETAATWGRLPDVTGAWGDTVATPGAANGPAPAPIEPPPGGWPALVLNEVDCRGDEWIELAGPPGADASGWVLTDDPAEPGLVLPAGTTVPALLVVPPFGFAIACGVDTVTLLRPDHTVADAVTPPLSDGTWGRMADRDGAWEETVPTPGAANVAWTRAPAEGWPALVLNELQCRGEEWIELWNPGPTDASVTAWSVTDGLASMSLTGVVAAGAVLLVSPLELGIACGDEVITLLRPDGSVADAELAPSWPDDATWGRVDGEWRATTPTPGAPNLAAPAPVVLVNEVECSGDEWIELYNPGDADVALDDWQLAGGALEAVTLAAGGYMVIPASGLACGLEVVTLARPDGVVADTVTLGATVRAHTWARLGEVWTAGEPTPGAPNSAPLDPAGALYDPLAVFEIDLTLGEGELQRLRDDPYGYVMGTLEIAAFATGPLTVGIRLKGVYGSFRGIDDKAGFRIDLNRYVDGQLLFGLEHLVLNNAVQDPTHLHETVAYRIFREQGLPAPRTGFAWVRVNGASRGLYVDVEVVDERFADRHYASTQHIYEGQYGADVVPGGSLEVDEGDPADQRDYDALAAAGAAPDASWVAELRAVADLEQLVRVWATEILLGHWDGYAPTINNYYLHSTNDGVFTMVPWGIDQTFSAHLPFLDGYAQLWSRCKGIDECRFEYARALGDAVAVVNGLDLDPWIVALRDTIAPWLAADPWRAGAAGDIAWWTDDMRGFLTSRMPAAAAWVACNLPGGADADGDGFDCAADCDDNNAESHPGAADVCGDGLDQDCSGAADDAIGCDDCWTIDLDLSRYRFCSNPRSFADARAHCQAFGASLLVLDAQGEEDLLRAGVAGFENHNSWLGLTDAAEEGVWLTAEGAPAPWLAWADGQPDDWQGAEHCAERWGPASWNDLDCGAPRAVVCEVPCEGPFADADGDGYVSKHTCGDDCDDADPASYPGAAELCGDGLDQNCDGVPDDGIGCEACESVSAGDHTYLVCAHARSFADAVAHCAALGAELLVLDSASEEDALIAAYSAFAERHTWVGLTDAANEGVWLTPAGATPAWAPWASGEPNDWGGGEDCVERYWPAWWNDIGCDAALAVTCRVNP